MYKLYFTHRPQKDAQLLKASYLKSKTEELLHLISKDPYSCPPEFESLKGDMKSAVSRQINKQHRLVYQVLEQEQAIKVIMMWSHYE